MLWPCHTLNYELEEIIFLCDSERKDRRCAHELTKTAKLSDVPSVQLNKAEGVLEHATQKVLNMSLQDITVGKVTQHHVDRVTTPTDQPVKTA